MAITKTFKDKSAKDIQEQRRVFLCWREAVDCFTSEEKLAELAHDKSPRIRSTVANNHSTPIETLLELSHDQDEDVANAALKNLDIRNKNDIKPETSLDTSEGPVI
ncbi:MAG: hypothetical protein CMH27_06520 [Micavibrio sp.]|nr:hypothetical protein [Micavibrio sp.]|tara:strand:+ start:149 stop:466 length:318 start_codon:yes stop_codon:yes gene_type:complete